MTGNKGELCENKILAQKTKSLSLESKSLFDKIFLQQSNLYQIQFTKWKLNELAKTTLLLRDFIEHFINARLCTTLMCFRYEKCVTNCMN